MYLLAQNLHIVLALVESHSTILFLERIEVKLNFSHFKEWKESFYAVEATQRDSSEPLTLDW